GGRLAQIDPGGRVLVRSDLRLPWQKEVAVCPSNRLRLSLPHSPSRFRAWNRGTGGLCAEAGVSAGGQGVNYPRRSERWANSAGGNWKPSGSRRAANLGRTPVAANWPCARPCESTPCWMN